GVLQSAIQPTSSNPFGELLGKVGPGIVRSIDGRERRGSEEGEKEGDKSGEFDGPREREGLRERERRQREEARKWKEVEVLREKRREGEENLDYTYYALLTSLSNLTSAVQSLHALATSSFNLRRSFQNSATELLNETNESIAAAVETLDRQAERAADLRQRMEIGRGRVEEMGKRLEKVRAKVEEAERKDGEGKIRVGRRLKVLWSLCGFWMVFLAIAIIARHGDGEQGRFDRGDVPGRSRSQNVSLDAGIGIVGGGLVNPKHVPSAMVRYTMTQPAVLTEKRTKESSSRVDAEATLRLLDEL
ncbi:MAG: hypothetical protein Q9217_005834, partial [Psora testacea]